jgi:hypothetical protein
MFKKLRMPFLILLAALVVAPVSGLARQYREHGSLFQVQVQVDPHYHHWRHCHGGFYDRWGHWHPYRCWE